MAKNKTIGTVTEVEAMDANAILIQELKAEIAEKNATITAHSATIAELDSKVTNLSAELEKVRTESETARMFIPANIIRRCNARRGQIVSHCPHIEGSDKIKGSAVKTGKQSEGKDRDLSSLSMEDRKRCDYLRGGVELAHKLEKFAGDWKVMAKES